MIDSKYMFCLEGEKLIAKKSTLGYSSLSTLMLENISNSNGAFLEEILFKKDNIVILFSKNNKENYFIDFENEILYSFQNIFNGKKTLFDTNNIIEELIPILLYKRVNPIIISKLFFLDLEKLIDIIYNLGYILHPEEQLDRRKKGVQKMRDRKTKEKLEFEKNTLS